MVIGNAYKVWDCNNRRIVTILSWYCNLNIVHYQNFSSLDDNKKLYIASRIKNKRIQKNLRFNVPNKKFNFYSILLELYIDMW